MTKQRLRVYHQMSRRVRWLLTLILMLMVAVGIYDQQSAILGDQWIRWWIAILVVGLIWTYYAILTRRASIQIHPNFIRLQGPLVGKNISYGRIYSVMPGHMSQHYSKERLKRGEEAIVRPFLNATCVFIELQNFPSSFKWRKLWFPRYLFGTNRRGIICCVEDWMALSRRIESARTGRQARIDPNRHKRQHTLVGHILAEDMDF